MIWAYLLSAGIATALAVVELFGTFKQSVPKVLFRGPALAVYALNGGLAALVLGIVDVLGNAGHPSIVMAVGVGLAAPTFLRSNLTLLHFRPRDESGPIDIGAPIYKAYNILQEWCTTRLDLLLADMRNSEAAHIVNQYTAEQLQTEIENRYNGLHLQDARAAGLKRLAEIIDAYGGTDKLHHNLAVFFLEDSVAGRKAHKSIDDPSRVPQDGE